MFVLQLTAAVMAQTSVSLPVRKDTEDREDREDTEDREDREDAEDREDTADCYEPPCHHFTSIWSIKAA